MGSVRELDLDIVLFRVVEYVAHGMRKEITQGHDTRRYRIQAILKAQDLTLVAGLSATGAIVAGHT